MSWVAPASQPTDPHVSVRCQPSLVATWSNAPKDPPAGVLELNSPCVQWYLDLDGHRKPAPHLLLETKAVALNEQRQGRTGLGVQELVAESQREIARNDNEAPSVSTGRHDVRRRRRRSRGCRPGH
jgi:hypothetical protein